MKNAASFVLLSTLAMTGCKSTPPPPPAQSAKPPMAQAAAIPEAPPRSVVQPEQVNAGNAHAVYHALWNEMDQDAQGDVQSTGWNAKAAPSSAPCSH